MSNKYHAKPINAPLITRPGESSEYVGTRNVTGLLPEIFKTDVNKRFFDSTLEQLMSSGSLQAINHYVGAKTHTRSKTDSYVEDGRTSDPYQFVPGLVNKDENGNITNALAYDDLLHNMNFSDVQLNQNSRVFDEEGYTLDLPINIDMFVNYHRYFWAVDVIPIIDVIAKASGPITIDDIVGKFEYTTPELSNGKTLEFKNGMRVRFESIDVERMHQTVAGNKIFESPISNPTESNVYLNNILQTEGVDYNKISATEYEFTTAPAVGDEVEIHCFWTISGTYQKEEVYIVDGVGTKAGISFTKQFVPVGNIENYGKRVWFNQTIYSGKSPTKFDQDGESFEFKPYDLRELKMQTREYTVEERTSVDQSAWARSNLWIHQETIEAICDFTDDNPKLYIDEKLRATRPIIEYKANIKKYNYGTKHLTFVDYMFDQLDPAVDIIGQPYFDLARHLATTTWINKGYNKGDLVKVVRNNETTYWDCKQTHGEAKDPVLFKNNKYWNQVYSKIIEDDELVLFINSSNADYNNKIFRVSGSTAENLALTLVYDLTDYEVGHKIMTINGYNAVFYDSHDNLIYSGSEWYWDGNTWIYGQQKEHTSQGALFQLYDTELVELDDTTVYPNSTFRGDRIFDYGKGSTRIDESLGFSPRYVDYGNTPGLSFDLELGAKRYHYNIIRENSTYHQTFDTGNTQEILGYYFYKMLDSNQYYNGWKLLRTGQPVKRHATFNVVNSTTPVVVELGTTDINTDNKFIINQKNGLYYFSTCSTLNTSTKIHKVSDSNPDMFVSKGREYHIQTLFNVSDIEFTDFDGNALSNVTITTVDNYNITLLVDAAYADSVIRYREVGNTSNTGLIYVDTNTNHLNLEVYINGKETVFYTIADTKLTVTHDFIKDDIVDVHWWSDSELNSKADGNFEPADTHLYNPFNDWASEVSFGDLQDHLRSQVTNIPGFSGDYFGNNNYTQLPRAHDFGGTIRKQPYSTALLNQLSSDVDTNIYNSIRYAAANYKKFKEQFLRKVEQLHKNLPIETPVYEIVDRALSDVNLGKGADSAYVNSNMALFKNFESADYAWQSGEPTNFKLPNVINTYNDVSNHIQAWLEDNDGWHSLVKDVDYTLTENRITINKLITYKTSNNSASLHVRWYAVNSESFVPPSAVKLGLIKPTVPGFENFDVESDNVSSRSVLIGHDGSITTRQGTNFTDRSTVGFSITDAALYDLELRIYNNLNPKLHNITDYKEIMPTANRLTSYNWDDFIAALEPDFKRFAITSGLTSITDPEYYDLANKFTWNYSSVGPGIGGWRGLYRYYFNTDRPHTHPWEMFGYSIKPTWWDANYSWIFTVKRNALIEALKTGHFNNPADTPEYNLTYAYTGYDWDNQKLVTTAGVLNDPITAGVVTTPGLADRAANFVFGDMSSLEFEWIKTSEFKFLQILALLRLRPLWVTNTFFDSTNRQVIRNANIPDDIIIDADVKQLGNFKNTKLSNTYYSDSIVEKINVKSSSDVTVTPTIDIFGNFGTSAAAKAIVEDNKVVAVSVTNPGKEYQSKPGVVFSNGNVVAESFLIKNVKKYFIGLSNAVIDFAHYNNTSATTIENRFKNASIQPIVKAGGFVNTNKQSFILESSQGKGRVTIPEENSQTLLYLNQPNHETFMGGLQFTKLAVGFSIVGIDRNSMSAFYLEPMKNSKKIISNFGDIMLERYSSYATTPSKLLYGESVDNLQDAYSFLLGHSEYLKSQGWVTNWQETAQEFVVWSQTANTGDTFICIPNTNKYEIYDGSRGYYDTVINRYDGVYNLIDHNGDEIAPNKIIVSRPINSTETSITTVETKENDTHILGLRLYRVELEHAIILENETDFDDVIYRPEIGQRHKRILWRGSRTKDWNGKLYSPGYLVTDNTIIDNFDTTANASLDYFTTSSATVSNDQAVNAARFNIGYNKPDWSKYLTLNDDSVFNFTKGSRKYRGTKYGLNAFMRNTSILGGVSDANLYELWAVRTADYGDIRSRDTVEFSINSELLSTSPQVIKFHDDDYDDISVDDVINIDPTSPLLVTGSTENVFRTRPSKKYNVLTLNELTQFNNDFVTAGLPLLTETDFRVINKEDFEAFPTKNKEAYDFSGTYQEIDAWSNRVSYKTNDLVIHEGYVWRMVDPDGSSGLQRPNEPIEVIGRVNTPSVPSDGQTLVIDNTVVTIKRTSESTTLETIEVTGSENLNIQGVPNSTTLILGQNSSINQTLTFENEVITLVWQPATKTGNVTNFSVEGNTDGSKELVIDGVSIVFDDAAPTTTNVTIEDGYQAAFNATFTSNQSTINSVTSTKIATFEALRTAVINNQGITGWNQLVADYFSNVSGLNINYLESIRLTLAVGSESELDAVIANDLDIINAIAGTTHSDPTLVPIADINTAKTALNSAPYITNIRNFAVNNSTSAFTANEIIATESGTGNKIYSDSEVVQKINDANIPNVTASLTAAGNLFISKDVPGATSQFSLVLSSASANAEVGFATTNETIRSSGVNVLSTPDLTAAQVAEQINAAGIPNVSAIALSSGQVRILSNAATLFIGAGSANSFIGLNTGITPAQITTITVDRTSDLTDTISSINNANIPGITASNSNNRLRLVSTNETMEIGSNGTANITLGITPQLYVASPGTVSNVFETERYDDLGNSYTVFEKTEFDPHVFSIWTADNSEKSNINAGYNVYQAMHFSMFITRACAGIEEADEAQLTIDLRDYADEYQPFHNLQVGDYVLIAGSNTVPSIDGVRKVTRIDTENPNMFYIDEYIQEEGNAGNVYPLRSVRFTSYADLIANFNSYVTNPLSTDAPVIFKYNFGGERHNGDPLYAFVDDDNGAPAVYRYTGKFTLTSGNYDGKWVKVRTAPNQSRSDLVENVKVYDANKRTLISALEIYDPAKGIMPGFIDSEIDFKSTADNAIYNYTTYNGYEENEDAWTDRFIGTRWWDLSTSIYLDYEQGTEKYQQQQWGRLFPGSEIEIYEWIRSPVLPEEYEEFAASGGSLDGTTATGQPYSKIIDGETRYFWSEYSYFNPLTNNSQTNYYFWVKKKESSSGIRNYNVNQLSNMLTNFKDLGIAWAAPSLDSNLLLANVDKLMTDDTVVQINQIYESNSLPLNEWTLLAENDPHTVIPEYLHIKIRDSLAGYNNYHDLYTYTEWGSATVYNRESVVIKDDKFYICLDDNVSGSDPTVDTDELQWARIYNYNLPPETESTDIEIWRGQPVPDLRLHEYNRYGHLTRPVQSLYRDITNARQNFVDATNEYLEDICVISEIINWDSVFYTTYIEGEVEYKLEHYWNFTDWSYKKYNTDGMLVYKHDTSIQPDYTFDDVTSIIPVLPDVDAAADIPDGSYVYIKNSLHNDGINRPEMWYKENGQYTLRWKKYGTIALSDELWLESKFGHGFDAAGFDISGFDSGVSNIINLLVDLLRNNVFVGQYKKYYNKLWFRCLYQAIIENTADDFAFKTTYVKLAVDHPLIRDPKTYQNYGTTAIEKYFEEIKPFHTKLHTLEQRPSTVDNMTIQVEDEYQSEITIRMDDYARQWNGDVVLLGGTFIDVPANDPFVEEDFVEGDYFNNNEFMHQFTTPDSTDDPFVDEDFVDSGYFDQVSEIETIYYGNRFIQPEYERIGEELVGLDLLENVRIMVQTNVSGSTEDANTRSFQINMFTNYDIQESIAIVNANKTTLSNDIREDDTIILLDDVNALGNTSGVIWIGTERIVYGAKDANGIRYCQRGTLGTSAQSHTAGDTVIDAGDSVKLPIRNKFGHYGDQLRLAYNELGRSLAASGTASDHAFIRDAGEGTI